MTFSNMTDKATFGAGCFWGVEEAFRKVEGVVETAVGYMGGGDKETTYEEVCTDTTGHAEVIQMEFAPEQVSYRELLEKFFDLHDPTQLNRQGPDVGTQYRSVVFYHSDGQREVAEQAKRDRDASGKYDQSVVTEISPAGVFHRAEEYHQQYVEKRGGGTCHV